MQIPFYKTWLRTYQIIYYSCTLVIKKQNIDKQNMHTHYFSNSNPIQLTNTFATEHKIIIMTCLSSSSSGLTNLNSPHPSVPNVNAQNADLIATLISPMIFSRRYRLYLPLVIPNSQIVLSSFLVSDLFPKGVETFQCPVVVLEHVQTEI